MPYLQLPGGPDESTYLRRLGACSTCRHRVAATCRPLQQVFSVAARLPGSLCPAGAWPDQPATLAAPPSTPATRRAKAAERRASRGRVSVAIICHNQGRYLAEALESLAAQTLTPCEILILDNASTDCTAEEADRLLAAWPSTAPPLTYHRRENGISLADARYTAYRQTSGEYLVCLDADDKLSPSYLAAAARILDDQRKTGIVWTELEQFGTASGLLPLTPWRNPHDENWMHSGAMVRRTALDQLDATDAWPIHWDNLAHHDWRLWRAVLARGWTHAKSPALYHYRRHADSLTTRQAREHTPWATLADLAHEPVTLFVAASGRRQILTTLCRILAKPHSNPLRLVVAVTTTDPEFLKELHALTTAALLSGQLADSRVYRQTVAPTGLADQDRHQPATHRAVQIAMSRIYGKALAECQTEYLWILEDDVEPPPTALAQMLAAFAPRVASVALPYRSRYQPAYVAWTPDGQPYHTPPLQTVGPVGGNGFGCVVLRKTWFAQIPVRSDGSGDFDPEFYRDLRDAGGIALVDWSTECRHGPPLETPTNAPADND